jgi:hypothetical protein
VVTILYLSDMRLELEDLELSTIVASLGKIRHYLEYVRKDQKTADSLQQIRLKTNKTRRTKGNVFFP